jgi:hypothetical protein
MGAGLVAWSHCSIQALSAAMSAGLVATGELLAEHQVLACAVGSEA